MTNLPDNFSTRAFDAAMGRDDDMIKLRADNRADRIIAHNKQIANVLELALAALEAIGEPDQYTATGCEWADTMQALRDGIPVTTVVATQQVYGWALEQAMEGV
jgi:hypothetical protein